jgi:hypothetical protein
LAGFEGENCGPFPSSFADCLEQRVLDIQQTSPGR